MLRKYISHNTLSNENEEVILEEGTMQQSALSHFETFNNVLLAKTVLLFSHRSRI